MLNMAALQVGVVEGEALESKSIVDSASFASCSSVSFWTRSTIRLTQGIDEIISSIFFCMSGFGSHP